MASKAARGLLKKLIALKKNQIEVFFLFAYFPSVESFGDYRCSLLTLILGPMHR